MPSASSQEACLQGNLIAICLEQLDDPHPLLRQWVAICLGRIWQNFDSARWCGVRDSAHEKLCSLLSDPIPEVSLSLAGDFRLSEVKVPAGMTGSAHRGLLVPTCHLVSGNRPLAQLAHQPPALTPGSLTDGSRSSCPRGLLAGARTPPWVLPIPAPSRWAAASCSLCGAPMHSGRGRASCPDPGAWQPGMRVTHPHPAGALCSCLRPRHVCGQLCGED